MELIIFIIIISVITSKFKNKNPREYEQVRQKIKDFKNEIMGEVRENINTRKSTYEQQYKRYEQSHRTYEMPKREEPKTATILERAKANVEEDKVDRTLHSLEAMHGHSAHVTPAIHHHPEDELSESMLGTVEDLMVKGYEGNLCFERDFLGEAMDMVSRFSLGGSVEHES